LGTTEWGCVLDEGGGRIRSGTALASGFVEDDGSGSGHVEGADAAGHGDAEEMIAGAANEIVEAGAFAAEDDDEIAGEIELVVSGRAALGNSRIQADNPEIATLELFEGSNEVDDTGDAEVLGGSGAGFDGSRAERSGAALGEEDAIDAGAIGDAKKRTEVLRIFNTVEREEETCGGIAG